MKREPPRGQLDPRGGAAHENAKQQPTFPDKVTVAVEKLPWCLAFLFLHPRLLPPDPPELPDGERPDGLVAQVSRGGDADAPRRRMDAQVDVPDVLAEDVHSNAAEEHGQPRQYSRRHR